MKKLLLLLTLIPSLAWAAVTVYPTATPTITGPANINGGTISTTTITVSGRILQGGIVDNGVSGIQSPSLEITGAGGSTTNSVLGLYALDANTSGINNAAFGYNALTSNTSGVSNLAIGSYALSTLTNGNGNIALGYYALHSSPSGSNAVAVGANALYKSTANANVGIGEAAGYDITSGNGNTAIGYQTGYGTTPANASVTDNNMTFIGENASRGIASATALSFATAVGAESIVSSSNTVVLGRATDHTLIGASLDNASGESLQVTGTAKISSGYTVATLPVGATGMHAYVTDAVAPTYLGLLVGAGTVVTPVFYNGAAWVSY